ncbi:MAG TPA: hypothetical protein VME22_14650 [Solirubrobacteraceae bacterium]|nr:hypothetical protein [Solirubrobacteraceae bacterium]
MFIPEANIEFPARREASPSRALDAVVTLLSVGIVMLVALAMLSVGNLASGVGQPTSPGTSNHLVSHVRLGR